MFLLDAPTTIECLYELSYVGPICSVVSPYQARTPTNLRASVSHFQCHYILIIDKELVRKTNVIS